MESNSELDVADDVADQTADGTRTYRCRSSMFWGLIGIAAVLIVAVVGTVGYELLRGGSVSWAATAIALLALLEAAFFLGMAHVQGGTISLDREGIAENSWGRDIYIAFDQVETIAPASFPFCRGAIAVRGDDETVRIANGVEAFEELISKLKQRVDANRPDPAYDPEWLFDFYARTVRIRRLNDRIVEWLPFWMVPFVGFIFGVFTMNVVGAHQSLTRSLTGMGLLIGALVVSMGGEWYLGRRFEKGRDAEAFEVPERDRGLEKRAWTLALGAATVVLVSVLFVVFW